MFYQTLRKFSSSFEKLLRNGNDLLLFFVFQIYVFILERECTHVHMCECIGREAEREGDRISGKFCRKYGA